ncbi:hypothetical protein DFH06DRAFT_1128238 [Mycena polygramma]|nr:hypothetical protein DFH06DRAFT_1128238 [Mycena polygramma]
MQLTTLLAFAFVSVAAAAPTKLAVRAQEVYTIHPNGDTTKCVGVLGGAFVVGAAVDIYDCNGSATQKWHNESPRMTNPADGSEWALDVARRLELPDHGSDPYQSWNGRGSPSVPAIRLNIQPGSKEMCLDLTDGSKANRNPLASEKLAAVSSLLPKERPPRNLIPPQNLSKPRSGPDPNAHLPLIQLPPELFDAIIELYTTLPLTFYHDTQNLPEPQYLGLLTSEVSGLQRICPNATHVRCIGGTGTTLISALTKKTEVFDGLVDWKDLKFVDRLIKKAPTQVELRGPVKWGKWLASQNEVPQEWNQVIPKRAALTKLAELTVTFPAAEDKPCDSAVIEAARTLMRAKSGRLVLGPSASVFESKRRSAAIFVGFLARRFVCGDSALALNQPRAAVGPATSPVELNQGHVFYVQPLI